MNLLAISQMNVGAEGFPDMLLLPRFLFTKLWRIFVDLFLATGYGHVASDAIEAQEIRPGKAETNRYDPMKGTRARSKSLSIPI